MTFGRIKFIFMPLSYIEAEGTVPFALRLMFYTLLFS